MATVKKLTVKKAVPKVKPVAKKLSKAKSASGGVAVKTLKANVKKAEVKELPKETGLKLSVYSISGKVLESLTLPKEIFGVDINDKLMAQAVRVYLANQRRGTVKTKSRGEVKITTKKIYKQKGTGRARHGAASAPIFVGGGVAFGPRQRDYSLSFSQKMKKAALFSALSTKLKSGEIKIITGLEKIEPKTKKMTGVFENLSLNGKNKQLLLVTPALNKDFANVIKASRNIEGVRVTSSNLLNTYEVLANKQILFMKNSLDILKDTFLKKN